VQVDWYRLLQVIGTGCYRLLVQVDSDRLIVAMVDSVTMIQVGCRSVVHIATVVQKYIS